MEVKVITTRRRVKYAFDMIALANSVSILSLDEMEAVVLRALAGEFEEDIRKEDANLGKNVGGIQGQEPKAGN